MAAIRAYEYDISHALIATLAQIPGLHLYGLSDTRRLEERVPTFAFTMEGYSPRQIAEKLAQENIFVWDGNYYALAVTERLGVEESGGMVRIGPVHYNTVSEITRLGEVLLTLR
jgi:selenocysteine lyase/cysteine desulfurase